MFGWGKDKRAESLEVAGRLRRKLADLGRKKQDATVGCLQFFLDVYEKLPVQPDACDALNIPEPLPFSAQALVRLRRRVELLEQASFPVVTDGERNAWVALGALHVADWLEDAQTPALLVNTLQQADADLLGLSLAGSPALSLDEDLLPGLHEHCLDMWRERCWHASYALLKAIEAQGELTALNGPECRSAIRAARYLVVLLHEYPLLDQNGRLADAASMDWVISPPPIMA